MGEETQPRRSLYTRFKEETATWVTILVGVTVIVGAVTAWLWPDGPSPEARYREALYEEVCQGDLAAAGRLSDFTNYAGSGGRIDKAAWLRAMETVRSYLVAGRAGLDDPVPPKSLRDEWRAILDALDASMRHWDEYRAYTARVPSSDLTVFDYPDGSWKATNASTGTALQTSLGRLMKKECVAEP